MVSGRSPGPGTQKDSACTFCAANGDNNTVANAAPRKSLRVRNALSARTMMNFLPVVVSASSKLARRVGCGISQTCGGKDAGPVSNAIGQRRHAGHAMKQR